MHRLIFFCLAFICMANCNTAISQERDNLECIEPLIVSQHSTIQLSDYVYKLDKEFQLLDHISLCHYAEKLETSYITETSAEVSYKYCFSLSNDTETLQKYYLSFDNPNIDEINLYRLGDSITKVFHFDERTFIPHREIPYFNCIIPIELPSSSQPDLYLVELIFYGSSLQTSIDLKRLDELILYESWITAIFGFYFGFEILLFVLLPFMLYIFRDYKLWLIFTGYHLIQFLTIADGYGLLLGYAFENLIEYEKKISIFLALLLIYLVPVVPKRILDLNHIKYIDPIRQLFFISMVIPLIIYHTPPELYLIYVRFPISIFVLFTLGVIVYLTYVGYKYDKTIYRILFIGNMFLLSGGIINILLNWGVIEYNFISKFSILIGGICETLAFFILIFYKGFKNEKSVQEQALREQQLIIEKQLALQAERNRIASEMHDDLGGGLTTIKFIGQRALRKIKDTEDRRLLTKIVNQSSALVNNMSEIIWAMNSGYDDMDSLIGYMRRYAKEYLEEHELKLDFTIQGATENIEMSGEKRRHIFLMIKEALHNIVKHAQATMVELSIEIKEEQMHISITDNGIGFQNQNNVGNGIKNIKQRTGQLAGTVIFDSKDSGTTLALTLPF